MSKVLTENKKLNEKVNRLKRMLGKSQEWT